MSEGVSRSRGAESLWNELDTVDSDKSDHEDWTESSAKVVLPMGQRLHELLQEDNLRSKEDDSRSKQDKSKQRQKGKSMFHHVYPSVLNFLECFCFDMVKKH